MSDGPSRGARRRLPRSTTAAVIGGAAVLVLLGAVAAACGGSSSESPWPVPPDSPVLGPEGEDGRPRPAGALPDAGADAAPDVEP